MASAEKVVITTALCSCNSTGHFIPPMIIFKRKYKKTSLTNHASPETIQGCSENCWINIYIYINVYIPIYLYKYIPQYVLHLMMTHIIK